MRQASFELLSIYFKKYIHGVHARYPIQMLVKEMNINTPLAIFFYSEYLKQ